MDIDAHHRFVWHAILLISLPLTNAKIGMNKQDPLLLLEHCKRSYNRHNNAMKVS
jgi:hypothetical protein